MKRAALLAGVLWCGMAAPVWAQATPQRVTIVSVFNPIVFGDNAYVNGQLVGEEQGNQGVSLEQSPFPFTTWTAIASATTDVNGYYSFKLRPSVTAHYRAVPASAPGTTSDREVPVDVAPRIVLTATAAGKSSIRFSGKFAPAKDGQSVAIERKHSNGSWTKVATARLKGGTTFAGRLRARGTTVLRAFFVSDGVNADGSSRPVRVSR